IGKEELTVGELTHRGYYLGSNVSYNVKRMVENGYLEQQRSLHDRRSIRVRLSEKGLELYGRLDEMYERHVVGLDATPVEGENLEEVVATLKRLERYWGGIVAGHTTATPLSARSAA
ncbi:MAG: MarR family winged helix-turn-helix transcriptional regulator, partial [Alphaproteobacteria bacterium]